MELLHTTDPTGPPPVCAAHVYADLTPGQHLELVIAQHGPWRVAARIVIVLPDQPRSGRPRLGSPPLGQRIHILFADL
jgi:hypothetical protein